MSRKEVTRAGLVRASVEGKITNEEGAKALNLTVRQFQHLKGDGERGERRHWPIAVGGGPQWQLT